MWWTQKTAFQLILLEVLVCDYLPLLLWACGDVYFMMCRKQIEKVSRGCLAPDLSDKGIASNELFHMALLPTGTTIW